MTLYRKYRPQKLSELDCLEIKERLANILKSSYTPHAFLFTGPKGTGKTSAARIVAKILNCEKKQKDKEQKLDAISIDACDKCTSCIAITNQNSMDVLEIDAASNRGIDEVRELREKIKFAPVSSKFKIYIVDEVHMLTSEAFNAILKTLEEPPSHAIFILATTEAEKLPETILSRCVRLNFKKALDSEIVHSLKRVAAGEKVNFQDEVLTSIARYSDGSFRDATKILEQAIFENVKTVDDINKILGTNSAGLEDFLDVLLSKDSRGGIIFVENLVKNGFNLKFFNESLLHKLHDILLEKNNVETLSESTAIKDKISQSDLIKMIKLFSRVYVEIKSAVSPNIPLEVAVVEWCEGQN